jgi:hypothetical protein
MTILSLAIQHFQCAVFYIYVHSFRLILTLDMVIFTYFKSHAPKTLASHLIGRKKSRGL